MDLLSIDKKKEIDEKAALILEDKKTYKEKFEDFFNNPPIDDEPWTGEDEKLWQGGKKEIAEGKIISWEQLEKEL